MGLRKVVQESNKVFETETLSANTFNVQPPVPSALATWSEGGLITGKVTCSIPFSELLQCSLLRDVELYAARYTGRSVIGCYWMCRRRLDRISARFPL